VKPQKLLGRTTTPEGVELVLYERDGAYSIRAGGLELMSSRAHGSEEALAQLVLERIEPKPSTRVLVGGLGLGYTLRAVLDHRPAVSSVVVAELMPAVVEWNRNELAHLAGSPLDDPRVSVVEGDVADLIGASPDAFDAVLLDVDNGPTGCTLARNEGLYGRESLIAIGRCLRPGGVLGVWSADPDPRFTRMLKKTGYRVEERQVSARTGSKGPRHTVFVAWISSGYRPARPR
jgi:spermidine synthase